MYTIETIATNAGLQHHVTRLWEPQGPQIKIPYADAPEVLALVIGNLPGGDIVKLLEELGEVKRKEIAKLFKKQFADEILVGGGYRD